MSQNTKKRSPKRSTLRSLTISEQFRFNSCSTTSVPYIRLCGNWLRELGFNPQQKVLITTMNNLLIIQAIPKPK